MFVVVYRWRVLPGKEAEFQRAWRALSDVYMQLRGQLDASLQQCDDGHWVGKAVWHSRDEYLMAHERGVPDTTLANAMNQLVIERLDPDFSEIDDASHWSS